MVSRFGCFVMLIGFVALMTWGLLWLPFVPSHRICAFQLHGYPATPPLPPLLGLKVMNDMD
ncbi:hypothetical protein HanIR_Chr07g0304901 [Helianthus annuus]|nr:hypothetical protein HanIR_Chr07g0304901 [Helianthus annuus]